MKVPEEEIDIQKLETAEMSLTGVLKVFFEMEEEEEKE